MGKPEVWEDWLPLRAGSPHRYRFEEPDLLIVRDDGDVSGADMARMYDLVEEFAARLRRRLFWITDISRLGRVTEEAGKVSIARDLKPHLRGSIVCGGSFHQRHLANMVVKAMRVLRPERGKGNMVFCATVAEARAIAEEQRRRSSGSS
ncbi:hypothetical protein [Polyangium sp. 6x1]|uniref:hypothetical protein n=1 Tax=Polyangium sp. 6x1 TaxID=3042689 RepID=UPI00248236D9|nr:hypothetical protein [Polyangium sp. 6x1]MDI1447402.1 hypothetical protein [Polyangium sp. 6x1]